MGEICSRNAVFARRDESVAVLALAHRLRGGKVYRSFTLDSAIDDRAAQAKYNEGVLELTLPKKAGGGPSKLTAS